MTGLVLTHFVYVTSDATYHGLRFVSRVLISRTYDTLINIPIQGIQHTLTQPTENTDFNTSHVVK